jgi:hypothetical protein
MPIMTTRTRSLSRFAPRVLVLAACGLFAPAWSVALAQPAPKPSEPSKPAASGEVNLRPKFKEGQQVRFALDMDITNQIGAGDESINSTVKQQLGLTLKVKQVAANGAATLDLVYDSLVFNSEGPTGSVTFDSSKPADPKDEFDGALRSVVGLTLTLQTDETGKITSVNVTGGGDKVPPGMLQQFSAADVVRGLFGPITSIKSDDGMAKVGESWTTETSMGGAIGSMKLKNDYTLRSHANSRAQIDLQGAISLDASMAGLARIREGSITGSATWNTEEGMLERQNMSMTMVVETQLTGQSGGQSAGQSAGSNRTTSKVTITRK